MNKAEIDSFSMRFLHEIHEESESPEGVWYGNDCLVGYNVRGDSATAHSVMSRPTRVNINMLMLCLEGSAAIRCDMQSHQLRRGALCVLKPGSIIQMEGHVERLSLLVFGESFTSGLNISFQKLFPHYTEMEKLTVINLEEPQTLRLNQLICYLSESIKSDSSQLFYHECVRSLASSVVYETLSLFSSSLRSVIDRKQSTRQEEFFRRFVHLLGQNFRTERRVAFYAEQLHITPKYLGTLIVQLTGRQASNWISGYVMAEAKALLLNSSMSIQEVAYALNFPNQSFFGKFFKLHAGMSPGEFRLQNRL